MTYRQRERACRGPPVFGAPDIAQRSRSPAPEGGREGEERRFDHIAWSFGLQGERVADPACVKSALDRCLAALNARRAAQVAPL